MAVFFYDTDIGNIGIEEKNELICNVYFNKIFINNTETNNTFLFNNIEINETPLLKEASIQLNNYLNGKLKVFSLPIIFEGTNFEKQIWEIINKIPYGTTN